MSRWSALDADLKIMYGGNIMHLLSNHHLIGLYEQSVELELDKEFLELILMEIKRRNLNPNGREMRAAAGQL